MRILYIDIDSLRADHVGCYGYHRPTTPNIDAIARQGVRFNNYYCSDSPCVPSRAACFSGRPGIRNGVVAHENTPAGCTFRYGNAEHFGAAPMFMHHLIHHGVNTVSFSSFANRHLAGWFHFGFKQFNLTSLKNGNEDAHEVNELAVPWFQQHARQDNWFVHLNYWDPHTLYTMPQSYMEMMARYPAPKWPDQAEIARQNREDVGIRTARSLWADNRYEGFGRSCVPTMPDAIRHRQDFEHLINGYDGAIRYVDEQLQLVIEVLREQGVLDQTAIVISAHHGETFGELGQYMEHGSASPAVTRVPLIIRWPGVTDQRANTASDELLYNIDLAPTVAEGLGLSMPSGWCGKSFFNLLDGGPLAEPRTLLFWSHGLHTRQRAVFDGRFLYIRTYHPAAYLYPPRMFFDLRSDPHQTKDLAAALPDRVRQMDDALSSWINENLAATNASDPMRDVQSQPPSMLSQPQGYLDRLRRENRQQDAAKLLEQWSRLDRDYGWQA